MTMGRWPTRLIPGAVLALAVVGSAIPSAADRTNPADRALDRAREAIHNYEFHGTVELSWHDQRGRHREDLPVVAVDGGLRVADGRVLQRNGQAWLRSDQRWTTLWSDGRDPKAPGIGAKYDIVRRRGPRIVGRTTDVLVIQRGRRVVERMAVDHETGMMLRRER